MKTPKKTEVAKKMKSTEHETKASCMNCGSKHPVAKIDYHGGGKWSCPNCKK